MQPHIKLNILNKDISAIASICSKLAREKFWHICHLIFLKANKLKQALAICKFKFLCCYLIQFPTIRTKELFIQKEKITIGTPLVFAFSICLDKHTLAFPSDA